MQRMKLKKERENQRQAELMKQGALAAHQNNKLAS
jgi:hypothetical protein